MTPRFKVWNSLTKEWFVPVYPDQKGNKDIKECFLSQGGDMYLHQKTVIKNTGPQIEEASISSIIHAPHLVPCLYTGCKDESGKKIYHNDVVTVPTEISEGRKVWSIGYVKLKGGMTWICSGPAESSTAEDSTSEHELKKARVVGNILETPDYFTLLKV